MSSKYKFPSIDVPSQDVRSLQLTILQLKETVELLTGVRPGVPAGPTWDDLVRIGVVKAADVPR